MPPAPLVPNVNLQDIAKVTYSDSLKAVVIEYNPNLALQVGPFVTAYHQAHEYGHFLRGHISKGKLKKDTTAHMTQVNTIMEVGADKYAIETLYSQDKTILLAMLDYLKKSETEELTNLAKLERIKHLEYRIAQLDEESNYFIVPCKHSAHGTDPWPCSHMTREGKTLHQSDPATCTHAAHPQGDKIKRTVNPR
ncbi:hypothetical protein TH61_12000 [Rufibacter sp. DG15C]|uniref:hypothetical protein n=1 Tax=Rufibacter sp. DG15C TaxID=1379909 RepID=UPI00078E899C|nr:hypothetical protein [Rufibacter sp. DG15C]AMM51753.1 hypothetical protein TH61_12000 [Rufibacter sp. DG15C]